MPRRFFFYVDCIDQLIIGAGPTGLGAAVRLHELGSRNFLVVETSDRVGGLCASYKDEAGFTWDVGGHVLFSQSHEFLHRISKIMDGELLEHERRALVRVEDLWIDYPFQDHIGQLRPQQAEECLDSIRHSRNSRAGPSSRISFGAWMRMAFGNGICRLFMEPYNRKVWAVPLHTMGSQWIKDRVSMPKVEDMERQIRGDGGEQKWGPNSTFFYPLAGGTGEIFRRLAKPIKDSILLNHAVTEVDLEKKALRTSNGKEFRFRSLLNTSPLDGFIEKIAFPISDPIRDAATRLKHNSVVVFGIGIPASHFNRTTWMYFPKPEIPFYRVTNLHNYSPNMTPKNGNQLALLAEVSYSNYQPLQSEGLADKVFEALKGVGLCSAHSRPLSIWHRNEEYGYPIPCLERERALNVIHPFLEKHDIFSRGRFGGWKYEIGNMDHSFMQGVEWAEKMVLGKKETIYFEA